MLRKEQVACLRHSFLSPVCYKAEFLVGIVECINTEAANHSRSHGSHGQTAAAAAARCWPPWGAPMESDEPEPRWAA
eukprot:1097542-Pelagomonas_calceolata.AAC.1